MINAKRNNNLTYTKKKKKKSNYLWNLNHEFSLLTVYFVVNDMSNKSIM